MPRLVVENEYEADLPGLGVRMLFIELSEKRVTRAVRDHLRGEYGHDNVHVSCSACLKDGRRWTGSCEINGSQLAYRIEPR
jgi:hypothetical protein